MYRQCSHPVHGDPRVCPWGLGLQRSFQQNPLLKEVFIIPSARTSSTVSLQLPSLRIFNLLTRCICWVSKCRVPPMKSFQERSNFSKSGREGSKATGNEHKKRQICTCHLWFVVNRIHCLLLCKRIEGGWTCWLSTKQGSLSHAVGGIMTFTFPISWDIFCFCQITALWKCSSVSVRFHTTSFIAEELVILLLWLLYHCHYKCILVLLFANPSDICRPVILLGLQAEGLGNTPGPLEWPGPLRWRIPVTFSVLSWSAGYHHLTKPLLYLHGPTHGSLDMHQAWPEPSLSLCHCSLKVKLTSMKKFLKTIFISCSNKAWKWKCQSQGGKASFFACFWTLVLNVKMVATF